MNDKPGVYIYNGSGSFINGPENLPNVNFITFIFDSKWDTMKRIILLFGWAYRVIFYTATYNAVDGIKWYKMFNFQNE